MTQKIIINLNNRTKHDINLEEFKKNAVLILHDTSLNGIVEIDLTICAKLFMQKINYKHRSINKPTDVLSFPLVPLYRGKPTKKSLPIDQSTPVHLGDIIICYEVAAKQAKENNKTINEEIIFLFNHGLKHLLGFHHK